MGHFGLRLVKKVHHWNHTRYSFNVCQVIETFQLKICEDQLMSRCTKCNGKFIQKPLTTEEAVEAAKGFQVIPNCLFNRNLEFWQCIDCNRLYWEVGILGMDLLYFSCQSLLLCN